MIYKVTYQDNQQDVPRRETTKSLYIKADSIADVRQRIAENTPYNVEYIEQLSKAHLEYEQERNPDFEVVSF